MIVLYIILSIIALLLILLLCLLLLKTRVIISYVNDELKIKIANGPFRYTLKNKDKPEKKEKKEKTEKERNNKEKTDIGKDNAASKETPSRDGDITDDDITKEKITKKVGGIKNKLTSKTSFIFSLVKNMRYKIEVVRISVFVEYGTGDPADTGILYGVIWAAVGNIYQVFNQYLVFDFPKVELKPDFENKVFNLKFEGIIRVRLVHIIIALIKSAKKIKQK